MCGRFTLTTTNEELLHRFAIKTEQNFPNRWNIAPSQTSLTLTSDDGFNLSLNNQDKFGIWQPGLKKRIINARSETITVRPLFKEAFKFARCLVLASGWFEWDANKTPYYISLKDNRVMAFAGLRFKEKENNSFVILTVSAKGYRFTINRSISFILCASIASKCDFSSLTASKPPCTLG